MPKPFIESFDGKPVTFGVDDCAPFATISEFVDAVAAFKMQGNADGAPDTPTDDEMTRLLERYD